MPISLQTYKSLSTHSEDMLCHGLDTALSYITIPPSADGQSLVTALCNMSSAIERGLLRNSFIGKAVSTKWPFTKSSLVLDLALYFEFSSTNTSLEERIIKFGNFLIIKIGYLFVLLMVGGSLLLGRGRDLARTL